MTYNQEKVKLVIERKILNACIKKAKEVVASKPLFEELGGLLLGYFDGINIYATDFIYDNDANTSAGSIHFSPDIFKNARTYIRKNKSSTLTTIVGTWHVHPPGYGTRYSDVDSSHLFQEKWLLKSDVIDAPTHKAHIIIDGAFGKEKPFSAYHMKILASFDTKEISAEKISKHKPELLEFLNSKFQDKTAVLLKDKENNDFNIIDFLPANMTEENIAGFWQHYPYKDVCLDFENIYLEHYYNKTGQENFFYLQTFGKSDAIDEIKFFEIQRQSESKAEQFEFVDVDFEFSGTDPQETEEENQNNEKAKKKNALSDLVSFGKNLNEISVIIQNQFNNDLIKQIKQKFANYPFLDNVIENIKTGKEKFKFNFFGYLQDEKSVFNDFGDLEGKKTNEVFWEVSEFPIAEFNLQNPSNPEQNQNNIQFGKSKQIADLALYLKKELDLQSVPQLYAYFTKDIADKMAERTTVEPDGKVYLPDDITIGATLNSLLDNRMPIYFETIEMNDERLFEQRTDRIRKVGYDVDKLNKKNILIGGAGLLGNEIAYNLAVIGAGNLTIIDYGTVDWYNIYRQPLFEITDVYQRKVDVVKEKLEKLRKINVNAIYKEVPCLASEPEPKEIKESILYFSELVKNSDIVVGAFDIFSARAVFQMLCLIHNKPFVTSALDANIGEVRLFEGNGNPCYCCGTSLEQTVDGGACTLSKIENQKIIGGITTKFIYDKLLEVPNLKNMFEFKDNMFTPLTAKYTNRVVNKKNKCVVCGKNGILKHKDNYIDFIYKWLFNRSEFM